MAAKPEIDSKRCTRCGSTISLSEFYRDKRATDGLYSHCKSCDKATTTARRRANPEQAREWSKQQYAANSAARKKSQRKWQEANRDAWLASKRNWQRDNYSKALASNAARRAALTQSIVAWSDMKSIAMLYAYAANSGMHVDHIVPLRSKLVSGLHVIANLRLLPAAENQSKGNRRWPDMP